MQVSDINEQELRNIKSHLAKIINDRDRYKQALLDIKHVSGNCVEVNETFDIYKIAKQALEKDDANQ